MSPCRLACLLLWSLSVYGLSALHVSVYAAEEGVYEAVALESPLQRELLEQASQLAQEFQRLGLVVEDAPYADWIERVGARLAPVATDDYLKYRFFLLRDPTPNAFALANGHVYVHTGTLAWLHNEAQLEALLAHELAHAAGHHTLVSSRVAARRDIGGTVVSGLLSPFAGIYTNVVDAGRSAATRISLSAYSRELEREADDRGVQLLQAHGLDASAMVALFEQLERTRTGGGDRGFALGRRHPTYGQRVAALRALTGPASDRATQLNQQFTAFVAPLSVKAVEAYVRANRFQTAVELSTVLAQRLPEDAAVHLVSGDAWLALGPLQGSPDRSLTPRERKRTQQERRRRSRKERYERGLSSAEGLINLARHLAEAEASYTKALSLDPDLAAAWRGLAEVYAARSQERKAAVAFLEYLRRYPAAPDGAIVLARAKRLAGVGGAPKQRALGEVVVLPPLVSTLERRVGADMARPAVAVAYEQRAATQTAISLRAAGYSVRLVSRETLEADSALQALHQAAQERFSTVRDALAGRGRRGVSRYALGSAAVSLARALETDALVFQQVDVSAAAWGQLTRAMTLSSLTFLFRDVAGAGHVDLLLVDGHEGEVLARHRAVSRVIAKRALGETEVVARLVEGALRDLRRPSVFTVQVHDAPSTLAAELERLEALLDAPGTGDIARQ